MKIKFSCKDMCVGNITYAWVIESTVNDYNLSIEFCGAVNEEGEVNLHSSCFAEIELTEMHHCDPDILTEVQNIISNDLEVERTQIYKPFGDDKETLRIRNESSFDSTIEDYNTILMAITAVLLKHEMIDEIETDDELLQLI